MNETTMTVVCSIVCIVLAIISLIISIMSFREKGFLFNNAYIWATKHERKTMNKKPHYRQTAIIFIFITALFICLAIECVLSTRWIMAVIAGVSFISIVYAIISSIKNLDSKS